MQSTNLSHFFPVVCHSLPRRVEESERAAHSLTIHASATHGLFKQNHQFPEILCLEMEIPVISNSSKLLIKIRSFIFTTITMTTTLNDQLLVNRSMCSTPSWPYNRFFSFIQHQIHGLRCPPPWPGVEASFQIPKSFSCHFPSAFAASNSHLFSEGK